MPATSKGRKTGWTTKIGGMTAHPVAFGIVILYALVWLGFDRHTFDFNAFATLAVWMMTLFIQRSSHRDTQALHAKLDELLRADTNARSELSMLDEKEPEFIAKHRNAQVKALKKTR